MTVERHEFRKRNTTSTVSSAPSISASSTLRTELRTRTPASRTISMRRARRQRLLQLRRCAAFTPSLTAVVLYSRDFTMSRPIACVPLNSAADFGSAAPASTSATWPSVIELPVALRDDERGEIFGTIEASLETDRTLLERARHVADRRREVLRAQRVRRPGRCRRRRPRDRSAARRR